MTGRRIIIVVALCVGSGAILFAGGGQERDSAAGSQVTTLTMWHNTGPTTQAFFEQMAQRYQSLNPDVRIIVEEQAGSWADFDAKTKLSLRSGRAPDILRTSDILASEYASSGFTIGAPESVTRFVEEQTIDPAVRTFSHLNLDVNEPVHIIVLGSHWRAVYYNRQHLIDAGLPERGARTWDEFREYAQALTRYEENGAIARSGFAFRMANPHAMISGWLHSAGGNYMTADMTRSGAATPEGRAASERAYQFIYDLTWNDRVGDIEAGDPRTMFYNGLASIHVDGTFFMENLSRNAPDLDYIVGTMPADRYSGAYLGNDAFVVTRDSRNPDEAWRFLSFVLEAENQAIYYDTFREARLPVYRDAAEAVMTELANPNIETALQQKNLRLRVLGPGAGAAWSALGQSVEAYLARQMTLDESLDWLVAQYDEILNDRPILEVQTPFTR
jgi:multiple sugar transport system substrate-binding protein